jgi:hypothetical protein
MMACFGEINAAISLADHNRAQPLARTVLDEKVLSALLNQPIGDKRYGLLSTLGALKVPQMHGSIKTLVKIRKSDDQFAQWREHLSKALLNVAELPDTGAAAKQAANIVASELNQGLAQVRTATEKSAGPKRHQGWINRV